MPLILASIDYHDHECRTSSSYTRCYSSCLLRAWPSAYTRWFFLDPRRYRRHCCPIHYRDQTESRTTARWGQQRQLRRHRNTRARQEDSLLSWRADTLVQIPATPFRLREVDAFHVIWIHNGACAVSLVWFPLENLPYHKSRRSRSSFETCRVRSVDLRPRRYVFQSQSVVLGTFTQYLTRYRPSMLLHIHDGRRRGREACYNSEVSRCLPARLEGQLYHLASCTDAEFSDLTHSIPDCE